MFPLNRHRPRRSLSTRYSGKSFRTLRAGLGFTAEPLVDDQVADVRSALLLLVGTVGFVLLIACANVANLQLARVATRGREIAVRAALGAGRGRIIRQLLTECLLLSVVSGALGLALGYFGVHALLRINPGDIPRIGEKGADVTMDWRVLGFTFGVSFLTGILFGLLPAIPASRADLSDSLRDSGSRSGRGVRENKARAVLVVTEMALALMLMAGSALLIRTYIALRAIAPGFEPHNVLTMDMWLDGPRFKRRLEWRNSRRSASSGSRVCQESRRLQQPVPFLSGQPIMTASRSKAALFRQTVIMVRPLGVASRQTISRYFGFLCFEDGRSTIATVQRLRSLC